MQFEVRLSGTLTTVRCASAILPRERGATMTFRVQTSCSHVIVVSPHTVISR